MEANHIREFLKQKDWVKEDEFKSSSELPRRQGEKSFGESDYEDEWDIISHILFGAENRKAISVTMSLLLILLKSSQESFVLLALAFINSCNVRKENKKQSLCQKTLIDSALTRWLSSVLGIFDGQTDLRHGLSA